MIEINIVIIISILLGIHFICVAIALCSIYRKIRSLSQGKRNKFTLREIDSLKRLRWLVVFLPIIGPIVGFSIARGAVPGIPDKGLMV